MKTWPSRILTLIPQTSILPGWIPFLREKHRYHFSRFRIIFIHINIYITFDWKRLKGRDKSLWFLVDFSTLKNRYFDNVSLLFSQVFRCQFLDTSWENLILWIFYFGIQQLCTYFPCLSSQPPFACLHPRHLLHLYPFPSLLPLTFWIWLNFFPRKKCFHQMNPSKYCIPTSTIQFFV